MTHDSERELWEQRYAAAGLIHGAEPSEFLASNSDKLPSRGIALDIAAGEGRNSVFLARRGLEVVAVDISERALRKCRDLAHDAGVSVHLAVQDLSRFVIPPATFDLIVNFNFLRRELAPQIVLGLKPGGVLVFETLTRDHLRWKPDFNPDFLLERGELVRMFHGLDLVKYREATISFTHNQQAGNRSVASIIARKHASLSTAYGVNSRH